MDAKGKFLAALLQASSPALAAGAVLRQFGGPPPAESSSFGDWKQEAETRLHYLANALAAGRPALFHDHVDWLRSAYASREVPLAILRQHLASLRDELREQLPAAVAQSASDVLEEAVAGAGEPPPAMEPALVGPRARTAQEYLRKVLEGRREEALDLVLAEVDAGADVWDVYTDIVGRAQIEIGRMWQAGELHIAEEHFASRVAEYVLDRLTARLPRALPNGRRVLISTVQGETHDIGARVVADRLRSAGWDAVFLGSSTPAGDLARAIRDFRADLLAVSMNLALHVISLSELIDTVRTELGEDAVPILVGGRPFAIVEDLWRVVGADAGAASGTAAVSAAAHLVPAASNGE